MVSDEVLEQAIRKAFEEVFMLMQKTANDVSKQTRATPDLECLHRLARTWIAIGLFVLLTTQVIYMVGQILSAWLDKYLAYRTALAHHEAAKERDSSSGDVKHTLTVEEEFGNSETMASVATSVAAYTWDGWDWEESA